MDPARPLRDIFADPVGNSGSSGADAAGPAEVLRAAGHPDLPDSLVAEAVGSYADTAPIEVAEHLSPYVMAHSPIPLPDQAEVEPAAWLEAVSTAPAVTVEEHDPLLGLDDPHVLPGLAAPPDNGDNSVGNAIDFGHGGGVAPVPDSGPDLPSPADTEGAYIPPDHIPGPDILREADDTHGHLDDPDGTDPGDTLDTWDDG